MISRTKPKFILAPYHITKIYKISIRNTSGPALTQTIQRSSLYRHSISNLYVRIDLKTRILILLSAVSLDNVSVTLGIYLHFSILFNNYQSFIVSWAFGKINHDILTYRPESLDKLNDLSAPSEMPTTRSLNTSRKPFNL